MTEPTAEDRPGLPLEIDVLELASWRSAGEPHVVLDVREAWEVEICALPDSRNLPMGQVPQRLGEVPGDVALVVLCHHGMRSTK